RLLVTWWDESLACRTEERKTVTPPLVFRLAMNTRTGLPRLHSHPQLLEPVRRTWEREILQRYDQLIGSDRATVVFETRLPFVSSASARFRVTVWPDASSRVPTVELTYPAETNPPARAPLAVPTWSDVFIDELSALLLIAEERGATPEEVATLAAV